MEISRSVNGIESHKVWLITGTSRGFGRCLVNSVLARGDLVIATARSLETIQDYPHSDRLRLLQLDVDDSQDVINARLEVAAKYWGRIDVLVNNAGYGLTGLFEEGGSAAVMNQYKTNVFGLINVTTAALPYMRAARSGTIVMMGSRISWSPYLPQVTCYASSKAAVRAFSESLAMEVRQFNIRVTIVEPGGFKTKGTDNNVEWRGVYEPIPDYDEFRTSTLEKIDPVMKAFRGDARKAMELVVDVVRGEGKAKGRPWPLHLFVGKEAFDSVKAKCEAVLSMLQGWEEVARDLDFDDPSDVRAF
ncbi:hypothetical protein JOM56_011489 [Amanita muscaria]